MLETKLPDGLELPCAECGAENYSTSFMQSSPIKQMMDAKGVCWNCAFWLVQVEKKHGTVIDGFIYGVGDIRLVPNSKRFQGMAGRRFDIEYFDGRRLTTHDLWAGSLIPAQYRDRIPDTARFVNGAARASVGGTTCWSSSNGSTGAQA